MRQHYTQSKASKNLDLHALANVSEAEAYMTLRQMRWLETAGAPVCPHCGCFNALVFKTRPIFRCRDCGHQFSVTSGTILASRKMSCRKLLYLIAQFVVNAKGCSSIDLSKHIGCQSMSAFIIAHKIREAMVMETADVILTGEVEVDGCYIGKSRRKSNWKENRVDLRFKPSRNQKVIGVIRQRGGLTLTTVNKRETLAIPIIIDRVDHNAVVYADEAAGWDRLRETFHLKQINHKECYSDGDACTNQAESFFSRVRRAEKGIYHHISGDYADLYAAEIAWRENNRRVSDAERYLKVLALTLRHPVSRRFGGYWQRGRS
ncbi:IS1595 family transposase [Beijerinckia sp. L45]|uniref:IS1595 family transposase n=1 Tax=Beijerinckia sp. L45 TaxID=1641855 RepID=UPI001FEF7A9D|nr:IS1595 family transposase [Beijerinckia sp. L45]